MANTLSDHNALVMDFPWCPKPRPTFQFHDMWVRDPEFLPLITSIYSQLSHKNPIINLKGFLKKARTTLQKLNKNKFADLRTQLCKAGADLEGNKVKLSGLAMVMTVQDTFLPKSSKGKLPFIFTPFRMIKDKQGKGLQRSKRLCINTIKASWETNSHPHHCIKLSKFECRTLVEKITGKIKQWSTRNLSFAGRAQLINTVIFGMFGFRASIFIMPQEVLDKVNQICRNYL
ncbi:hypothetical protein Cgig2_000165 [Carnegiea gigantea]|uniref:Reverse transcriptase n=1 Tax=Carnegiea gigantea TaxID=171969 RepID=A0A9Q1JHU5_9CARY|nr:hypothetical protein Cgig2_000165 [Carnegiea gigantea]